jgi:spore coat polysaccharide biosynthesis predicted glycosyltransferase SpsG
MYFVNNDLPTMQILKKNNLPYRVSAIDHGEGLFDEDNLIIIDTKKDVPGQVEFLKCRGRNVVLIDNNTAATELADFVITPSPFFEENYDEQSARLKGGSEYIMIGDVFHEQRATSLMLKYALPLRVLVTMGGADPNHITEKVVSALSEVNGIKVDVVVGPASEPEESIFSAERGGNGKFRVHRDLPNLASLMAGAHIAFTALGTTINELAFMAVPSIVISNYFDDTHDLEKVKELGIGVPLGHHSDADASVIVKAAEGFVKDKSLWETMRTKSAALTDGLGADRVAAIIVGELEQEKDE